MTRRVTKDKWMCELCFHPYQPTSSRQKYCSKECKNEAYRSKKRK